MRRELFAAASVLVLMTGGAFAQSTSTMPSGGTSTTTTTSTTHSEQLASAEKMLGKNVVGQDGNKVGEVEDVILDPTSGQARQLVIGSGGFLGIGEKQIAVDFNQAQWNQANDEVRLSGLTREDVRNMAEFEYSDSMTSLNRPHKSGSSSSTTTTTTPATPGASGGSTGTITTPSPQSPQ